MKKILLFLFLSLNLVAFGSDKLQVKALTDFSSINPSSYFDATLVKDGTINDMFMIKGDVINCRIIKVTDPKRAKQNAKIYMQVMSYKDKKGTHDFQEVYIAKYAKTALTKDEIKNIPPKTIVKKTASAVGNFFVKGFSYAVSFVDGFSENEENNRLKSGAKKVYKDSFLSYIEEGSEVEIKKGDVFYLIIKKVKDVEKEARSADPEELKVVQKVEQSDISNNAQDEKIDLEE